MKDKNMLASNSVQRFLDEETLEEAAACLKVLAHPVRLKIVDILTQGKPSVGEIAKMCALPHHRVCEHLRLMQKCGFLTSERVGRSVYYSIVSAKLPWIIDCIRKNCGS